MIITKTTGDAARIEKESSHGDDLVLEKYIGDDHEPRGPQAFCITWSPGHVSNPHFHVVDQFQVFVEGNAMFGKHACAPVTIHYADRFTPYGPIVVGDAKVRFYNLRNHGDHGAHWMPGAKDEMPHRAGRSLTAQTRSTLAGDAGGMRYEALLGPFADGLGAYEVVCGAGNRLIDVVAGGTGRYQLVLDGAVIHDGEKLDEGTVTYVPAGEMLAARHAGDMGVHLLELQLPSL